MRGETDRGASSVIGVILMVAVVVVIGGVLFVFGFSFLDGFGTPSAEASFEYEQTPAGLVMTPEAIGTDVVVRLNGQQVATFEKGSAGESVLLPTAPGDEITVIAQDGDQSVLVTRQIDERSEVGDLIAYYPFESGTGNTIVDESGNGNDGLAKDGQGSDPPVRATECGPSLRFDGNVGQHVDMGNLSLDDQSSISEITVAIAYKYDGTGNDIQNLIEYQSNNVAWFIETERGEAGDPHKMRFNIGYNTNPQEEISTGEIPADQTQVLIGTYDGEEMSLYRNGNLEGTATLDREVQLGEVILGADSDPTSVGQNLDGTLCEVRLYYTAFDDDGVDALTKLLG